MKALTDPGFRGDPALAEAWAGVDVRDARRRHRRVHPEAGVRAVPRAQRHHRRPPGAPSGGLGGGTSSSRRPVQYQPRGFRAVPSRFPKLSRGGHSAPTASYHLGGPAISSIHLRFFTDYASAAQALSAGELNGLMVRDTVTEGQLAGPLAASRASKSSRCSGRLHVLYLNNDQAATLRRCARAQGALDGIDRKAITDKVFLGAATPSSSPIAPGFVGPIAADYDATAPDLDSARALLAEAGWDAPSHERDSHSTTARSSASRFAQTTTRHGWPSPRRSPASWSRSAFAPRSPAPPFPSCGETFSRSASYDAADGRLGQGPDRTPTSAGTAPSRAPPASTSPTSGMWSWTN